MEFINKIELQGIVGNTKVDTVEETKRIRFSLCTQNVYNSKDGDTVIDCAWFGCTAWQDDKIKDISKIKKGTTVHLKGRVRVQKYYHANDAIKYAWEIVCQEIEVIE